MEISIIISNVILYMREFQEKNNIKKQCITNTQYLYDCIKMNSRNTNVKAKAVLVVSNDDETDTSVFVGGHLVVVLDDELILDPSYDVFSLKNRSYFDNIKDLMDMFSDKHTLKTKVDIKKLIEQHIQFKKYADQINNDECLVSEKKNYNTQADYVEELMNKIII